MCADTISIRGRALAETYTPASTVYDELKDPGGELRPHYRALFDHLGALAPGELEKRWEKAQQLLHENGVSYNVYGDPQGMDRPWSLSPLPVLLPPESWQELESGFAQRARLLDALLRDLYGAQRVLLEGLLPPELVFENPLFLRPCHRLSVPGERFLPLYSADVVRMPSGDFAVLEDRTQAPSGTGYALENRIIISSVLPEVFRGCNVERLSHFFRALRETLHGLSPHNRDNPHIVLLTPGPYNATYFEQAYLAQYLGYTLVGGGDLTVRDDRVYLKTLGGLQQVDVILRRVNDDYCDPLELRPDSLLGVPGLVQSARMGNVALANPLGSGLVQTPAMLPYLPGLCRVLLGEELRLPSVRTFWCGSSDALREAMAYWDDAVVKQAFARGFVQPVLTAQLDSAARAELRARIEENPRHYVIQEHAHASTTAVLADSRLTPRALVMRCYAVLGHDDCAVMPGALARVADAAEGTEASMQLGARSKDTWVLARDAVPHFTLLPPSRPLELSRGGSDLPSRATDNLYWLGRYAERAESVARLARKLGALLSELTSDAPIQPGSELVPLLRALVAQSSLNYTAELSEHPGADVAGAHAELVRAVFDEHCAGSLRAVIHSTLRAGRLVRDRISTDTWRVLSALDDDLRAASAPSFGSLAEVQEVLQRVVLRLAAFTGLVMDSMTRGHAWRFLDMGRRLERAMALVTLLRATLTRRCERDGPLLEAVLEIADSSMTYRRRYLAALQVAPVVDLLLTDDSNPRSVIYQIEALRRHLDALPVTESGMRTPQARMALGVLADLELTDVARVSAASEHGERELLSDLLVDLATRIPALSDSLSHRYLNHATTSRHLTGEDGAFVPTIRSRGAS